MTRRPIRFRFWCEPGKAFVQNYNYNGAVDDLFNEEDPTLFPTQYTGCNDYQGKEIWEGDIVEFEKTFVGEVEETKILKAVVEYIEGGYVCKIINPSGTLSYIHLYAFFNTYKFTNILRVIGNKFENPELTLMQQDPPYPNFIGSWDDKTYKEASEQKYPPYMDLVGCCDVEPRDKAYGERLDKDEKLYGFYHKPTKLWVYFLPNYEERQVISLGLKKDATTFEEEMIYEFTHFLRSCSFNGNKNYALENLLEFELKEI